MTVNNASLQAFYDQFNAMTPQQKSAFTSTYGSQEQKTQDFYNQYNAMTPQEQQAFTNAYGSEAQKTQQFYNQYNAMAPQEQAGIAQIANYNLAMSQPAYGLSGANKAIEDAQFNNVAALTSGAAGAGNILNKAQVSNVGAVSAGVAGAGNITNQALMGNIAALGSYVPQGQQAGGLQAAYSGAMGAPAQQQAFNNFTASPGQEWLRQQAEQGTLRNAAAIGGLGGGNVRQELQRQAMGLAQQDFQNQYNNLGTVADRGYNAGNALSGYNTQLQGANAGYAYNAGKDLANFNTQLQGANAGYAYNMGNDIANYNTQLQGAKAGYAYGAGQDIANNRAATTSALAQIANQQGSGLSDMYGSYTGNIANLLAGAGGAQATSNQSLANLLANLATGSQSNFVGASGLPNTTQSQGMLGSIGNALGGVGTFAESPAGAATGAAIMSMFSDARLKTNITRVGTTAGGNALYTWDWTPHGKALAGAQPAFGVIAQEVNQDAVVMGSDGWLRVDYTRVL